LKDKKAIKTSLIENKLKGQTVPHIFLVLKKELIKVIGTYSKPEARQVYRYIF
jgi:hypothetical protein